MRRLFTHFSLGMLVFSLTTSSVQAESNTQDTIMTTDIGKIANIRASHDSTIMAIPGVVSIATGLDQGGRPCLKIGTSVPVELVIPHLPAELDEINVEVEYLGEIKAE